MPAVWFTDHRHARSSEAYGRHSLANASVPVVVLLQRAVAGGDGLRLAWSGEGHEQADEWPTAVLPRAREPVDELPARDRASWL